MAYKMKDFELDYIKKHFAKRMPDEQREVLQSPPPDKLLEILSVEKFRKYQDQLIAEGSAKSRKPRRKK